MNQIQRLLFKCYLYLLPLMLLPGLTQLRDLISPTASIQNGLFILLISFPLLIVSQKGKILCPKGALYISAIRLCLLLAGLSFLTSLVLYVPFGPLNGENTLKASFPVLIYLGLTAVTFYYNAVLFQWINKKQIERIFDFLVFFEIAIGFFQIGLLFFPFLSPIYNLLSAAGIVVPGDFIQQMQRICLTAPEPAAAGIMGSIFLLPYILGRVLTRSGVKYTLCAGLLMVLLFCTYSSTAYIGLLINSVMFGLLYVKTNFSSQAFKKLITVTMFLLLVILGSGNYIWNHTIIGNKLNKFLFEKTTSQEDLSTLSRYSIVYADVKAFLHYPVTGVGNGNQGYFYNEAAYKTMPSFALNYEEIYERLSGRLGIVNGGAFLPAFISGYGLVGILLLFLFIKKCVQYMRQHPEEYGGFRYMYYIGGVAFLGLSSVVCGLDGEFVSLFVVSLPFMQPLRRD